MNERRRLPHCPVCHGAGITGFPRAVEAHAVIQHGDQEVSRTIYEGPVEVVRGHYINLKGQRVRVWQVDGKWVTAHEMKEKTLG